MIKRLWHNTSNDSTIIMQYILTSWQEELVVVMDRKHPLVGAPSVGTYVGTWHISTIGLESMLHQFALSSFWLPYTIVYTTIIGLHYPNFTWVDYEGSAWTPTTWDGPYLRTCQQIPYPLIGLVYSSEHTNELASHWHLEAVVVQFGQWALLFESFDHLAWFYFHLEFEFQAFQHT